MSTHNPSHGTKVSDPNAPEIREGAGAIASDSLAADSSRSGGGFSSNRNSEPSGVAGANSTFANTNTSGARRLDPAIDAESREAEADWGEESKLQAAAKSAGLDEVGYRTGTGGDSGDVGTAPTYVNSQGKETRPKGEGLTDGFEGGNHSNREGEIGSRMDPGRLAEEKFTRVNAGDSTLSAGMPTQQGDVGDNTYETLGRDESA